MTLLQPIHMVAFRASVMNYLSGRYITLLWKLVSLRAYPYGRARKFFNTQCGNVKFGGPFDEERQLRIYLRALENNGCIHEDDHNARYTERPYAFNDMEHTIERQRIKQRRLGASEWRRMNRYQKPCVQCQ
ncbi:hypothetical protein Tcan_10343 [Toxocara canis]|uniref:Uncharacterized protein n=1 Tax=Toxocara canis TaxID=6265 RepID=A0A0B2VX03_TOXCA|nr:hypothetical protein Tcan_10343 [Toxocara canis]